MKSTNLIQSIVSVFIFALFLQSCSDDNQISTPSAINVNGKIAGLLNQGVPGIEVFVNGQSSVTAADGSFGFSSVNTPYSLRLVNGTTTYYMNTLSASNIRIPDFSTTSSALTGNISVTIPNQVFQPGVSAKIMFTDGNYVNAYGMAGNPITVYFPDNSPVTGKLIVLTYKKNSSGNIISYENFGESAPLTLSAGGDLTYNFTMNELALNPGESNISGQFELPAGYSPQLQMFYLSFSSKLTRSYVSLVEFETITGINFNLVIPTGLPRQYSTLVCNHINNSSAEYSQECFDVPAGSAGIVLQNRKPSQILFPAEGATNVDFNSQLSYSQESVEGIYLVTLSNLTSGKDFVFLTDQNSVSFTEIGLDNFRNSNFTCSIRKVGPTTSVNNYLTAFSEQVGTYHAVSQFRSFSTAP